ncbi:MAG: hypothetical protein J6V90_08235 [Treponema sp.]|nr:hypothetical protein [Treponema sp.]
MEQKLAEQVSTKEIVERLRGMSIDDLETNMKAYTQCLKKMVEDFNERLAQIRASFKDLFSFMDTGVVMGVSLSGHSIAATLSGDADSIKD